VGVEEELRRVLPVIRALRDRLSVPVSIDSSKAEVAEAAIGEGAVLVNDVWGGRRDPRMLEVIANAGVACCLMHNKEKAEYGDLVGEVSGTLAGIADAALAAGIEADRIILDPGIGFGKSVEDNIVLMRNLGRLNGLGFPWLIGASRKSMIGKTLDLPKEERVEGTIATTVLAIQAGCSFVRVHDVRENVRAARMTDRIVRRGD
jgi:dihydropteroate synthase